MAVLHYNKDMCGTKAKTIKSTDEKSLVTCKRCLNRMKSSTAGKIRVEKMKGHVILSYKRLQLRFKMHDANDQFMFCSPDGYTFTSPALKGTQVKKMMTQKDRTYFTSVLTSLKDNGVLTGENVYNHFKE